MNVIMPQLGETVAEGTVAAWHKKVGDQVTQDEVLLDVETEKVATEIPAPASGVLTAIMVEEGETVDVGTVLAVIGDPDAATAEPEPPSEEGREELMEGPMEAASPAIEVVEATAEEVEATGMRAVDRSLQGPQLSPVVRRLISEHQLEVEQIPGSGRNGRITRNDVLTFVAGGGASAAAVQLVQPPVQEPVLEPTVQQPVAEPTVQQPVVVEAAAETTRVPFDRIRRVTADHMVRSKATSPHVLQAVEVDFSAVDRMRFEVREGWRNQHGFSLTYLPFIARAVCMAIREFPRVNASVEDDALLIHNSINLAIAVDLNFEGLVAPVIRNAADLTVPEFAHAFHDVSQRAKDNALYPDDLSGGTYTLSNPGAFGMLFTAPIINQPQVAILSIDGIKKRPVVVESPEGDGIAIRPVGVLAQSFDHRAFDGAYSAAFLNKLRGLIEQTDWAAEL